jgi:NAD(P)-dependent dehydrogenase (short-subunit alcohol dehydrogenase family)
MPELNDLAEMRLLVVGASSGIGRSIGVIAATRGARVAFAARSTPEPFESSAGIEPDSYVTLQCDASRAEDCERVVAESISALGGLTSLVYAAAAPAARLVDAFDGAFLENAFRTNVIGAALVVRAALPQLRANRGSVALLSSETVRTPRPGLVAYGATKAALESLADGFRTEVPEVSFTRVVIGPTADTRLGSTLDPELLGQLTKLWRDRGIRDDVWMDPDDVALSVLDAISAPASVHEIAVFGRGLQR